MPAGTKAAEMLQAEAGSYHDQNTAAEIAEGRTDVLGITDVVEVGQVYNWIEFYSMRDADDNMAEASPLPPEDDGTGDASIWMTEM